MIYVYKVRRVQVQCDNSYSGVKIGEGEHDINV